MVEKVGHSKRMQVTRRAWLDDTKPYRNDVSPDLDMSGGNGSGTAIDDELVGVAGDIAQNPGKNGSGIDDVRELFGEEPAVTAQKKQEVPLDEDDEPGDDELDALLAENSSREAAQRVGVRKQRGPFEDDDSDEDELDAFMVEQQFEQSKTTTLGKKEGRVTPPANDNRDEFADDEEAMASMGGMW